MPFSVHRDGLTVFVSGFITVHSTWMTKPESMDPAQAGVTSVLREHGFAPVYVRDGMLVHPRWDEQTPMGWYDDCKVVASSPEAADLAESVLRARCAPVTG